MLRIFAALAGSALTGYLVVSSGPKQLLQNARAIAWGMIYVIALAGITHIVKTWAWRLTLMQGANKVSFLRTLALRLISEAIGQFGFPGLIFGESMRVALLGPEASIDRRVSSVALDRGMFVATGAVITIAGLFGATTSLAMSGMLRVYTCLCVLVLLLQLIFLVLAFRNGWPLLTWPARTAALMPWLRNRLISRMAMVESAENLLLQFHAHAPGRFWASILLNLLCHFLAIAEIYLILSLLGIRINLLVALILESLTKLINVVGAINPGNLGTYEGGNMAIGELLGFSGSVGLTLGLCRRLRAAFWAIVGGLCLAWFSKASQPALAR